MLCLLMRTKLSFDLGIFMTYDLLQEKAHKYGSAKDHLRWRHTDLLKNKTNLMHHESPLTQLMKRFHQIAT